jgi:hypothetical protein
MKHSTKFPERFSPGRTRDCSRRKLYASEIWWPPTECPSRNVRTSNGGTTKQRRPFGGTWRLGSWLPISRLSRKQAPHTLEGPGAADRAANLLIRKHGTEAELEAAKRPDLMFDRGDHEGSTNGRGSGGRLRTYRRANLRQTELGRRRNHGSSGRSQLYSVSPLSP